MTGLVQSMSIDSTRPQHRFDSDCTFDTKCAVIAAGSECIGVIGVSLRIEGPRDLHRKLQL